MRAEMKTYLVAAHLVVEAVVAPSEGAVGTGGPHVNTTAVAVRCPTELAFDAAAVLDVNGSEAEVVAPGGELELATGKLEVLEARGLATSVTEVSYNPSTFNEEKPEGSKRVTHTLALPPSKPVRQRLLDAVGL